MRMVFFPLLLCATQALSQTTIAGHHVGETIPEFIAAEKGYADKVAACHAGAPKPITRAQVHAMKETDLVMLRISMAGMPDKKELEKLADQSKLMPTDERTTGEQAFCKSLLGALEEGSFAPIYDTSGPRLRMWGFRNRVLSYIYLVLPDESFQTSEDTMIARLGEKPHVSFMPMQNAMGANWKNGMAQWLNNELFASVLDDRNPVSPSVTLTVYSRNTYDLERARLATASPPF